MWDNDSETKFKSGSDITTNIKSDLKQALSISELEYILAPLRLASRNIVIWNSKLPTSTNAPPEYSTEENRAIHVDFLPKKGGIVKSLSGFSLESDCHRDTIPEDEKFHNFLTEEILAPYLQDLSDTSTTVASNTNSTNTSSTVSSYVKLFPKKDPKMRILLISAEDDLLVPTCHTETAKKYVEEHCCLSSRVKLIRVPWGGHCPPSGKNFFPV